MLLNALCECIMQISPSPAEVVEANARYAVCTAAQCFEGDADAFGLGPTPVAPSLLASALPLVAIYAVQLAWAAHQAQQKASTIEV